MSHSSSRPRRGNIQTNPVVAARSVSWSDGVSMLEDRLVVAVTRQATWMHDGVEIALEGHGMISFAVHEVTVTASLDRGLPGYIVRRKVTGDLVAVVV